MAKNNQYDEKTRKELKGLDAISKNLLAMIDPTYKDQQILTGRDADLQNTIQDTLNLTKGISGGSIVDFISTIRETNYFGTGPTNPNKPPNRANNGDTYLDNTELFTRDIGDIYGYFQDVYKNRYLEVADLKFISKFIPAIGEAVKATLDAVVSSDDTSVVISRSLVFPPSLTSAEKALAEAEIKRIENQYGILKKLKNIVYKRSLITGMFYVYHISYKELFETYSKLKAAGKVETPFNYINVNAFSQTQNTQRKKAGFVMANESTMCKVANEAITVLNFHTENGATFGHSLEAAGFTTDDTKRLLPIIGDRMGNVVINNTEGCIYEAVIEAAVLDETGQNLFKYQNAFKGSIDVNFSPEATISMDKATSSAQKFDTCGTYLKYIDAKNIIPLRVYNQVIGYYHVHATHRRKNSSGKPNTSSSISGIGASLFSSASISQQKQEGAVNAIVDTISQGILSNFNSKFVEGNPEFRNLIADCIVANGLIDNDFNIQFIPANQIIPFILNEDENGMGESMLADSLFPAKMLLSLVVSKMLNYMNNSGSTTIAHIHKGPIGTSTDNQIQRVIRNMTEADINFNDLISSNMVFSKFSRNSRMQLPTANDGAKLVEFEVQEGQQIDMNPEFESWLERNAIMGTGVPSVIMDYTNADYSKAYTTGTIKFAGRIASDQSDYEPPTTELYRYLIADSGLPDDLKGKLVNTFQFKLPRPKVLTNANNNEYFNSLISTAESVANLLIGPSGSDQRDPLFEQKRHEFVKNFIINNTPFFDWETTRQIEEQSALAVIKRQTIRNADNEETNPDQNISTDEPSSDNEDF